MVSIKNYATQQFLTNTMNSLGWNRNGVWNGLQDWADETKWQWSTEDGSKISHTTLIEKKRIF